MSKIWFTSDPHYWHKNIAGSKVSSWESGYRNFNDEQEMSRHIVKIWNQTVSEDDILYCLGDWCFGGLQNIWNFRKQLRCKNIHLILGNHDEHIRKNKILPNCIWDDAKDRNIIIDGDIKTQIENDYSFNELTSNEVFAKEVFSSVNEVLTIKHGQHTFFLSHYSHRIWFGSHKGIIHLWGHSHGSASDYGKSMDVGIDSAYKRLGEYRPFSIEEIIQTMEKKDIEFIDRRSNRLI